MSTHHHEHHNESSESLRDFVIGMADGLTVPFALVAGLSGAVDSTALIITAGVAEIAAGCIAMGLGGYMGAKTESEHYASEYARELYEIRELTHVEEKETRDILLDFGVAEEHAPLIIEGLKKDPKKWADFMMRFELGLDKPDPSRLFKSPLIIGGAYVAGGMVPLSPYILLGNVHQALPISCIVSIIALFAFGAFKGHYTGQKPLKTGFTTTLIGAAAAGTAFFHRQAHRWLMAVVFDKPRPIPKAPSAEYLERAALYYLERFSASSAHLETVLRRKILRRCKLRGEAAEPFYALIPPLIARYVESGLLDDARYTQAKVSSLRRKGASARMITAKLAQKGVGRELVVQHIEADETSELDAARNLARRKKLGRDESQEQKNRDLATLARAGFSYNIAKKALEEPTD